MAYPSRCYRAESGDRKAARLVATVSILLSTHSGSLLAQQPPGAATPEADPWSGKVSLGANLSFGNSEWYFVTSSAEIMRADDVAEIGVSGDYTYGEASDNQGRNFVNRRSWSVGTALDLYPAAGVSPFAFASVESSLQAKLERRWIGGAGAKLAFVRQEGTRLDLSPAVLVVRTEPELLGSPDTHVRWSIRVRAIRNRRPDRIQASARIYYQPRITDMSRYLVTVRTTLGVRLSEHLVLNATFFDRYDSEAEERGARSNNDGRLSLDLTVEL